MTARNNKIDVGTILMTMDAVGGIWRYGLDLACGLRSKGVETIFAGFGPHPSDPQRREAEAIGKLVWLDAPLDWTVESEAPLKRVPDLIADLAAREGAELVHLNLPSQAAGLDAPAPVVVVSHSCVVTWFAGVRRHNLPDEWQWHCRLNRSGFDRADAVLAPSRSHAAMLEQAYGSIDGLQVVYNASRVEALETEMENFVFAAGRWWDEGKNGAILDAAAEHIAWPVVMAGANSGPNGQYRSLHNVIYRGELTHAEVMALTAKAAIVVSPSVYEPFGLAVLEAARLGRALVLSDIPIYRELWDGAALFADPRDPEAFADAVNRLSQDPALRELLAGRALSRAGNYTLEAQTQTVMQLYANLLSPSHALTAAE